MSNILTVRTTTLEAFRQFIYCASEDKPWINEPNLIATIQGVSEAGVKADFGTAGHLLIEDYPQYKTGDVYKVNEFTFTEEQIKPLVKFHHEHPLMIRETQLARMYHIGGYDLILTGTCDHLEGQVMRDTKFKFSNFDVSDFIDSIQYKAYLHMLGMKYFVYDFFRVHGFDTLADCHKARISDVEEMALVWNDSFENDLYRLMGEFMEYVVHRYLLPFLKINKEKAKKIIAGGIDLK